jgi:hypothetical protein
MPPCRSIPLDAVRIPRDTLIWNAVDRVPRAGTATCRPPRWTHGRTALRAGGGVRAGSVDVFFALDGAFDVYPNSLTRKVEATTRIELVYTVLQTVA